MSTITIALAGLGSRGKDAYAQALAGMPERARIVAVADPDPDKVREVARQFEVPAERCFSSAEAMLAQPKLADALILCTQDRQHVPQAVPALYRGYDILMEKPISPDLAQCKEILSVARQTGRKVVVCHVLRYAPFYRKIKEVLDSGVLGRLMSIQAIENVGYWHQAHSFVRGNWRRSDETSPMFLQKCCHDMDLMVWLTGKSCLRLSSFGSLSHFRPENAPAGAARAIETGPYGRCVYFCDNNVVDHQVVNLEMEDGLTVNFTMSAFTAGGGRYTNFMGTLGNLIADMAGNTVTVTPFGGKAEVFDFNLEKERMSGHAGGDSVLVGDFLDYLQGKTPPSITTLEASMESHFIALAAEASRCRAGEVVEMAAFRAGEPGRP